MRWCVDPAGAHDVIGQSCTAPALAGVVGEKQMLQWLEIIVGLIGAIGVVCAFVLGYRAPRNSEPTFELSFDDGPDEGGIARCALVASNPSDRPILLRSLVIQNPNRGIFFLSDAPGRSRAGTYEASDASDVLAIDLEVAPDQAIEVDFYVGRERRGASRELVADIEFSTTRTPSIVRSETLRAKFPSGAAEHGRSSGMMARREMSAS